MQFQIHPQPHPVMNQAKKNLTTPFYEPNVVNSDMPLVNLKPLHHRDQECIGIYYANHLSINNVVKKIPGVKWSQTNKCWYLPLGRDSYDHLSKTLKGVAELDSTALKTYLQKRKQVAAAAVPVQNNKKKAEAINLVSPAWRLSKDNLAALEKFIEQLKAESI